MSDNTKGTIILGVNSRSLTFSMRCDETTEQYYHNDTEMKCFIGTLRGADPDNQNFITKLELIMKVPVNDFYQLPFALLKDEVYKITIEKDLYTPEDHVPELNPK